MSLFRAVAAALTGEDFGEDGGDPTSPQDIVAALAQQGWTRDRIAAHRAQLMADEQRWPQPISAELRGGVGAAQASATLAAVRALLAVDDEARVRSAGAQLDQRDRQLIAELPPHHVQR